MLKVLMYGVIILMGCNFNAAHANNPSRGTQLIKNALIIDGSGAPGYRGDLRFENGKIISVGTLEQLATDNIINANGMVLTPGFIDSHSHHDSDLDDSTAATAAISQGITTIVAGNDGSSNFPLSEFRQRLETSPAAVNIASYTGHGSLRFQVMGADYKRQATNKEITQMQALLIEELKHGSLGLSTGLEYDPGIYSSTTEVVTLAKTVAGRGGRYISHMRSEDRAFHEAVEELISIGREAKLPVQISHIKLAAIDLWGQAGQVIERLDEARKEGIDVTADIYPYTYWHSTLTVLLPDRDFNDLDAARFALEKLAPANGLTLADYAPNPSLIGKTVAEIATTRGTSNEETYLQLIQDAYEGITIDELETLDEPRESVIGVSMSESDISAFLKWQHTNICSDGARNRHPRGHGSFPRAIRKYVREQGIVTLEEMIQKMTSLSAGHLGLQGRGLLKPGFSADLVLFNPQTITDKATIEQPALLSVGIAGVWVNGKRAWKNQASTAARAGEFVSRAQSRQQ